MMWHFGLLAVPVSQMCEKRVLLCVMCICRGVSLVSPRLALYRADNTIQSGPSGTGATQVVLLNVCFPVCEVSSQTV